MKKIITYTNSNGLSMTFGYKKPYLLEKIDCCSGDAVIIAESLAGCSGQITIDKKMPGKSIQLDLSVVLPGLDAETLENRLQYIRSLFDPMLSGVLTVRTPSTYYTIDCYSLQSVLPEKQAANYKYNFHINLKSDSAYFKKGAPVTKVITSSTYSINSDSVPDVPMIITFPSGYSGLFTVRGRSITLRTLPSAAILNTENMSLLDELGNDMSQYYSINSAVDKLRLRYGTNSIATTLSSGQSITVQFYDLSGGVP